MPGPADTAVELRMLAGGGTRSAGSAGRSLFCPSAVTGRIVQIIPGNCPATGAKQSMADSKLDELRVPVQTQSFHGVVLVKCNGSRRDTEPSSDDLHRQPAHKKLQHFQLSRRQL